MNLHKPQRARIMRLAKTFGTLALCILIPIGLLNTTYHWGYRSGYRSGSVDMRDAIMCVLERTAKIAPYKYCATMTPPRRAQ